MEDATEAKQKYAQRDEKKTATKKKEERNVLRCFGLITVATFENRHFV